jgi:hypothetical protein
MTRPVSDWLLVEKRFEERQQFIARQRAAAMLDRRAEIGRPVQRRDGEFKRDGKPLFARQRAVRQIVG